MDTGSEKRRLTRYSYPSFAVLIFAPSLSEVMLYPEDITLDGFKVEISYKPKVGNLINFSVDIKGQIFEDYQAKVVWVNQNEIDTPTWSVGLSLHTPKDKEGDFYASLKKAFAELGEKP